MFASHWNNEQNIKGQPSRLLRRFRSIYKQNFGIVDSREKIKTKCFPEDDFFIANEEHSCQEECEENGSFCALGQVI